MNMDTINGLFEIGGALITLLSVRQLLHDRMLRGAHWGPTIFFTAWGCWNLAYYPHLHQPLSTIGAIWLVLTNTLYLGLMVRFSGQRCRRDVRHHPNCRCECLSLPDGTLLERPTEIVLHIHGPVSLEQREAITAYCRHISKREARSGR